MISNQNIHIQSKGWWKKNSRHDLNYSKTLTFEVFGEYSASFLLRQANDIQTTHFLFFVLFFYFFFFHNNPQKKNYFSLCYFFHVEKTNYLFVLLLNYFHVVFFFLQLLTKCAHVLYGQVWVCIYYYYCCFYLYKESRE